MTRSQPLLFSIVVALFIGSSGTLAAQDQSFTDYTWARALYKEFRFFDLAEEIFRDMAEGPDRDATEKLQGRLGLAELKQSQARRSDSLEEQMTLYEESRSLMGEVLESWGDKTSDAYFDALFTQVDLLQEIGESRMQAVTQGTVPQDKVADFKARARLTFEDGIKMLDGLIRQLGRPSIETERAKWRLYNRARYTRCLALMNASVALGKGTSASAIGLGNASRDLQAFILDNERPEEEARIAAFYGYILKGRVHAALDEIDKATDFFVSVIRQLPWERRDQPNWRIPPVAQSIGERAYFRLLETLNDANRAADAVKYGEAMTQRFEKGNLVASSIGRAAFVELAEARFTLGDLGGALEIASGVVDAAGGDASGRYANRLVADIIAVTPDKTQFSPEILRSAAKGAYAAPGGARRLDAIEYFRILLSVVDRIEDREQRDYYRAEAWHMMGRALFFMDRKLEAALCFSQVRDGLHTVKRDGLNRKLAGLYRSTLRTLRSGTRSEQIDKLHSEMEAWITQEPGRSLVEVSAGSVKYDQAGRVEREAKKLARSGDSAGALRKFAEAAGIYREAIALGGPRKEGALIKAARMGLEAGKIKAKAGQPGAEEDYQTARKTFSDYLDFVRDPANELNDPTAQAARRSAIGQARFLIADVNVRSLRALKGSDSATEAQRKELHRSVIESLDGYAADYPEQTGLLGIGFAYMINAHLALDEVDQAAQVLDTFAQVAPKDRNFPVSNYKLGKAVRAQFEAKWEPLVGEANPLDGAEWDAVLAKPGATEARAGMIRAFDYYRNWLEGSGSASQKFDNWNFVARGYYDLGELRTSSELGVIAAQRFGDSAKASSLLWLKRRIFYANVELALRALGSGDNTAASGHWTIAGRFADEFQESQRRPGVAELRAIALTYGGTLPKALITTARADYSAKAAQGTGKHQKAAELWKRVEGALSGSASGSDAWWEAKFHYYLNIYRWGKSSDSKGAPSLSALKAALGQLRASTYSGSGGGVARWENDAFKLRMAWLEQRR